MEDDLVLLVSPEHPWAGRNGISLRDVVGQDLILREEGSGSRQILLDALAKQGIRPEDLTVTSELGSCEEVALAVESGLGVAFVSRVAAERTLAAGRLLAVPVPDTNLRHSIYLVKNRKQACSCAHLKFCDLVHSPDVAVELADLSGADRAAP